MGGARKTRVLIVDDSAVVRRTMAELVSAAPDLEVMGMANDPFDAAAQLRQAVPDVITLDVEMPRMDGITFLRRLMAQHPVPVIVCSTLLGAGTRTLMQALEAGAVDVLQKPAIGTRQFLEESTIRIQDAVRAAAQARVGLRRPGVARAPAVAAPPEGGGALAKTTQTVVAVGASTGGTEALRFLLKSMPAFAPPIAIVQHMPAEFTRVFAERLDATARITVREARHGDSLLRGEALIAPGQPSHDPRPFGRDLPRPDRGRPADQPPPPLGRQAVPIGRPGGGVECRRRHHAQHGGRRRGGAARDARGGRLHGGAGRGELRGLRHAARGHAPRSG